MATDDIRRKMDETYEELFNLRFQYVMGQLEDHNRLTALRRDIARMKTILRERELAAQMEGEAA
jgi:large subunit ribosomal protein L29